MSAFFISSLIPVDYCHLVILNIFPNNIESQVTSQGPREVLLLILCSMYINSKFCEKYIFIKNVVSGFTIINSRSTFN